MFDVRFNLNIDDSISVVSSPLRFKSRSNYRKFSFNDYKLSNNVSRSKTNCFNIVLNNKFTYFFTQTISPIYSRTDLSFIIKKFRSILNKICKLYPNYKFDYLIIPELHSDSKSWHLHGFLSAPFGLLTENNSNGFKSIKYLSDLGFNSVSTIYNYSACCRYILKYITKDTAKILKRGQHLYYCSKGLVRSNTINRLVFSQIPPLHFDFKNQYCFKTTISKNKYYNFVKSIDSITRLHYYNNNKM